MALTKVDDRGLTTPIDLQDDEKIRLGTGNDLEMYGVASDGTAAIINHANGDLLIKHGSDKQLISRDDGAIELYHDDSLRIATASGGNTLHGAQQNLNGDVKFDNQTNSGMDLRWDESLNRLHFEQDNMKTVYGTGSDFEIYHDGTYNIIKSANSHNIELKIGSNTVIKAGGGGEAQLLYNGNTKLQTTSTGVSVTEDLNFSGTNYNGWEWDKSSDHIKLKDNTRLLMGSGNSDFNMRHDGTYNWLQNQTGYPLLLDGGSGGVAIISGANYAGGKCAQFFHNGSAILYWDNSEKLRTQSYGVDVTGNLGINVASPDSPLEVGGTGPSLATIHHTDGGTNDEARLMLGALSSNPPDQRGAGISARNKGAGHDLEIQTSSTHSAGPSTKMIVTAGGDTLPAADSAHNLGANTIRWANVYADTYYGDGSNLTGMFVTGMIMLWSGASNAIPTGWVLCNGSNSTPDLRDRFVVGAGGNYSVGATGGADTVTLSINEIPSHNHNLLYNSGSFGGSSGAVTPRGTNTPTTPGLTDRISNTGGGAAHENRPPYYALCYIMKT